MNSTFSILKKAVITFSFFCFLNAAAQVQVVAAPEKMSYQAVIRNASNNLVASQAVGMQISILKASATGTAVYVETQTPTTNANGLVSLQIGSGTLVSGAMGTIDWSQGPYFIKTETDPTGGTNYTITGTTQLLSVPYALYAKTSGSSTPGPQGIQGATGPAGQGVPTGGTANQVLAKVNGTDYNTQWVTPASGGGSGSSLQLTVTKTVNQTTINFSGTGLGDIVTFESNNGTGAALTGGNTWTNNSTFTVGANGAGTYLININLTTQAFNAHWAPMIDFNNTGNSANSIYGLSNGFSSYYPTISTAPTYKGRGTLTTVLYMVPGDNFVVRGASNNPNQAPVINGDATSRLTIVKLN